MLERYREALRRAQPTVAAMSKRVISRLRSVHERSAGNHILVLEPMHRALAHPIIDALIDHPRAQRLGVMCNQDLARALNMAGRQGLEVHELPADARKAITGGSELQSWIEAALRRLRPDALLVTTADLCDAGVLRALTEGRCALRRTRTVLIYHWLDAGYARDRKLARLRERAWSLPSVTPMLVDETEISRIAATAPAVAELLRPVGYPFSPVKFEKEQARAHFSLPAGRWVGITGNIQARKRVDVLLRVLLGSSELKDTGVALIGPIEESIRQTLKVEFSADVRDGRLFCADRYLSEQELWQALAAFDVVVATCQRKRGISAMAIQAALLGKPFVAPSTPWMEALAKSSACGYLYEDPESEGGLTRSIAEALDATPVEPTAELLHRYSEDRYLRQLLDESDRNHSAGLLSRAVSFSLGRVKALGENWVDRRL